MHKTISVPEKRQL